MIIKVGLLNEIAYGLNYLKTYALACIVTWNIVDMRVTLFCFKVPLYDNRYDVL